MTPNRDAAYVPSHTCDRCGHAIDVRRVMLYVEGRPMNEHAVCTRCLFRVFEALEPDQAAVALEAQASGPNPTPAPPPPATL